MSRVEGTVVESGQGPSPGGPVETSGYISEDADNMDQNDSMLFFISYVFNEQINLNKLLKLRYGK